jgi:hypothetical protein
VKTVQTRKNSSQLDSANDSRCSRSRSSGNGNNVNNNNENIGFRMSLKNINKAARDDDLFDKI